jgi:hypothetical protein
MGTSAGEYGRRGGVARRRVFYVPGYDPFPARRYREMYRREGARQAAVSGFSLEVRGVPGTGGRRWRAEARIEGRDVEAEFELLAWADLVRASMGGGIARTYARALCTGWLYLRTGALARLLRLSRGAVIAALYPVAMLAAQALAALAAGIGAGMLAGAVAGLPAWAAVPPGALAAWGVLAAFRAADARFLAHYLMHDYAYAARSGGAYPPELARRIEDFADRVAAALAEDWDEVLVVGHSSGAHVALSVLAGLIRDGRAGPRGARPALGLLTLGHVVPMLSFLPGAARLRGDLALMAGQGRAAWVDVTAPGDGACFALCDPVAVSGVAPAGKRWPLVLSAAFSRTLAPETWARMRRRFYDLHFQYLRAFERPGDYDYFRVTAGPLTLAARFAGRAPSTSRVETPLSPFRDMAT